MFQLSTLLGSAGGKKAKKESHEAATVTGGGTLVGKRQVTTRKNKL
jgi:hypothetical protein